MGFIVGVGVGIVLVLLTGWLASRGADRVPVDRSAVLRALKERDELEDRLTKALSEQIEWRARALDPEWLKSVHTNRDLANFVRPPKDPTELDRWLEEGRDE